MNADLFNGKGVIAHQEIPGLLRSFDVINDLRWLHGCLDDPRHATNLVLDRSGKRLIHHCLQLLHAHDAQAFIYELDHRQVIQFDLLPLPNDSRLSDLPYKTGYVLHYRQPVVRDGLSFLLNGLGLVRAVFKQYDSKRQLFLPILKGSFADKRLALAAGFQFLEEQPAGLKVDILVADYSS